MKEQSKKIIYVCRPFVTLLKRMTSSSSQVDENQVVGIEFLPVIPWHSIHQWGKHH
jgi:hypothetical protein